MSYAVPAPTVIAVSRNGGHDFSKPVRDEIQLVAGLGVEGDAHAGVRVKHRSHAARDPLRPNLRQVHLIHCELFDEVASQGYRVAPGDLGENVTTRGLDLLGLSAGTVLHLGSEAAVEVTGLRDPCAQINGVAPGLLKTMVARNADGTIQRKSGVMAIVLSGGVVKAGDSIRIEPPAEHVPLQPV